MGLRTLLVTSCRSYNEGKVLRIAFFHHLNQCFGIPFISVGGDVSNLLYTATVIFKKLYPLSVMKLN